MNRAEWLQLRRKSIGASEAAALFNLHPYHSPFSLWAEKTGQVDPPEESTDQQEFGLVIEPYLAKRYQRETGRTVMDLTPHSVFHAPKNLPAAATPDRLFTIDESQGGVLELKRWSHFSPSDEVPAHAQIQVQQQMLCTDLKLASFAILGPFDKFYTVDTERNDPFIELLIEKIQEFWHWVKTGTKPPVDGHSATTEALKRLHPKDSGATIQLPIEAEEWTSKLATVKKQISDLKGEESALENSLKVAIGAATYGRLPDGSGWSFKTTSRAGYSVDPTEYRQLRRSTKLLTA